MPGGYVLESNFDYCTKVVRRAHKPEKKFLLKAERLDKDPHRITLETHLVKQLKHPNILQYVDSFDTDRHRYLILEHADCSLKWILNRHKYVLTEKEAFFYFKSLISALEYCHRRMICHGELGFQQLLVSTTGQLKISGFGLYVVKQDENGQPVVQLDKEDLIFDGSPANCSPEILRGERMSFAVDIWASGIILYTLVHGVPPFEDEMTWKTIRNITSGNVEISETLSPECQDLLRRLLCIIPSNRPTIDQIRKHSWWLSVDRDFTQMLSRLLSTLNRGFWSDVDFYFA